MSTFWVKVLKWITAGCEAFLGIPFIGGAFIIGMGWSPLAFMLIFHIIVLILSKISGVASSGSILGIITSCLGWIPFVGMILHMISAIVLMIDALRGTKVSVSR